MVLKAAVIGLGVGEQHIYGYEQGNECQVVSLCDKNHEKLKEVGLRHPGKKTFTDPEKILFDESIDIVSIATYDDSHYELIEKSIKNGKHIFVEKPLCLTTKEYNCICDLLRANPQIKVSSNLILRKSPRFINLKRKVDEGIFGEPYYFEGDYDYGRIHKILNGWRGEITNYSVVHGGAIHLIDLISWIFKKKVIEVFAYGTNIATKNHQLGFNDMVSSLLKFENGAIAKIGSNYSCVTPHFHRLSIYGTRGTFQQSHAGTVFIDSRDPSIMPDIIDDPYPGVEKSDLIPSFVNSISENSECNVTKQEVCDVMAISLAIEESIKTGSKVSVDYRTV